MSNDSIQSNKPIVPNKPHTAAPAPKPKAKPKTPVPVGQRNATPKPTQENKDDWDKMCEEFSAEPNWFKKAKIYLKFCRDSHNKNPEALERANQIAGL